MGEVAATRARVEGDLTRIVDRGLGFPELAHTIGPALHRAVPFEGMCLLTVDPATLLPTGEVTTNALPPAARMRMIEIEFCEPDVNKFAALARSPVKTVTLSGATGGDLDRSLRQRELRGPSGFGDELRSLLTNATGSWGALTLLRTAEQPYFTPAEVRFVNSVTPILADGMRRAAVLGDADHDGRTDTGFLVLAADNAVELANPAAEQWIDELSPFDPRGARLPTAIRAVAAQARRIAAGDRDVRAKARVRTRAGHWIVVHASPAGDGQVAVLLEAARPAELATTIADAYGLTDRERAITALVARGLSTTQIARRLHLSAYTVQDHLKAIFAKTETNSRGELVSRLFFDHHITGLTSTS